MHFREFRGSLNYSCKCIAPSGLEEYRAHQFFLAVGRLLVWQRPVLSRLLYNGLLFSLVTALVSFYLSF